jgi:DNA-binding XRE family transcriptional regulator
MEHITADEIKRVRKKLDMNQEDFSELMGVSRSCIGQWETASSNPRGENKTGLIKLYLEHYKDPEAPKSNGKAKPKANGSSNGRQAQLAGGARGGRHKVSVVETQEFMTVLAGLKAESVARAVADRCDLNYTQFRKGLVFFLYGMDDPKLTQFAQALSGHE